MSLEDFDNQFDNIINEFKMVEPLSPQTILEGLRTLVEANLYIQDYLNEFFHSMQESAEEIREAMLSDADEMYLELPAFSQKSTVYLTLLFESAKLFCDTMEEEDGDDDEEEDED